MTEGSPIRLLISFALPLMVGNVFQIGRASCRERV